MSVSIGDVVGTIKITDEGSTTFEKVARSAEAFAGKMDLIGSRIEKVGKTLTVGLTLPLAALIGSSVKAASTFESSFAGVRKTVDATEKQFASLAKELRALAAGPNAVPIDVNSLNKVAEAAGQLGIKRQDIVAFTRTMADLGETTNLTADEAATATAQFQNIFGAAGKEVDRLGSTIVALGNAGASTEKQIIEMSLRIAGAGSQIGLSQGEVLAFASTLSSLGIDAEAGGSAISKIMIEIALAVSKGGRELDNFAAIAGTTSKQFAATFSNDAAGAVEDFISGLGNLKETGGDVLGTLDAIGITEVRMRDALLRASGAGDLLTNSLALQSEAWSDNTALAKEAQERYKTFESQLRLTKNQINDAAITLGTALLPAIRDLLSTLQPLIAGTARFAEWFSTLPEPVRATALAITALVAALGPTLFVVGGVMQGVAALSSAFAAIAPAIGAAAAVLTGPVGWIAAGVALLIAWKPTRDFIVGLASTIADLYVKAVKGAIDIAMAWWDSIEDIRNLIADLAGVVGDFTGAQLSDYLVVIKTVISNLSAWARETAEGIKFTFNFARAIREDLFSAIGAVIGAVKTVIGWYVQYTLWVGKLISQVADSITVFLNWSGILPAVRGAINIVISGLSILWQWLVKAKDKLLEWIEMAGGMAPVLTLLNPALGVSLGLLSRWSDRAKELAKNNKDVAATQGEVNKKVEEGAKIPPPKPPPPLPPTMLLTEDQEKALKSINDRIDAMVRERDAQVALLAALKEGPEAYLAERRAQEIANAVFEVRQELLQSQLTLTPALQAKIVSLTGAIFDSKEAAEAYNRVLAVVEQARNKVLTPLPDTDPWGAFADNGILTAFNAALADQKSVLQEINGEHNRQARAIVAVNALLSAGLITEEQRNEYMRQFSDMWEVLPAKITIAQQLMLDMQDALIGAALAGSTALADGLVAAAFEGKEAWDDLGESLEQILKRLIADWLAQWFQAMAQWLARWIATQTTAKAATAAMGGGGGGAGMYAGLFQMAGAASAGGGATAGAGAGGFSSSLYGYALAAFALYVVYKGFVEKHTAEWGAVNLKTGVRTGDTAKVKATVQARVDELRQQLRDISEMLELDLQELGDVTLGKRGKSYYVQIGQNVQEGFATVEAAMDYARVAAIKFGTLGDQISANVRQAIDKSLAKTMEEFQADIDLAKKIDTIKLGEVGSQLLEIFKLRTQEIQHAQALGLSIKELIEARKEEFDAIRNSLLGINDSVVKYLKDLFSYQKGAEEAYSKLRNTFEKILGTTIEEAEKFVKEYGDALSGFAFVPGSGRPGKDDTGAVGGQWLDAAGNAVDDTTRAILSKVDRFKKALERYYEQLAALPEKLTEDQMRLGIFNQLFGFIEGNAKLAAKYEKERAAFAKLQVDIQFKLIKLWLEAFGVFEEFAALFNDAYQVALQTAGRPPGRSGGGGGTNRKEIREGLLDQIREIEAELKGPLHSQFLQFAKALADFKEEAKKGKLSAEDLARGVAALTEQFQRSLREQANALAGIGTDFTRRLDNVKKFFAELRELGKDKTGMPKWLVNLLEGKALDALGKELNQAIAAFGGLTDPMMAITMQAGVLKENVLAFAQAAGWSAEQIDAAMKAIDAGVEYQRQQGINSLLDRLFTWAKQAGILAKETLEHERMKALLDLTIIEAQLRFYGAMTAEIEGWLAGIRNWVNSPAFGGNDKDIQNVRVVNSDNDWDEIVDKIKSLVDDWRQAVKQFADSTAALMTDEGLTNLTQEEQLAFAKAQVEDLAAKAKGGDIEALQKLDAARAEFLKELRESEGAGFGFDKGWDWVMGLTADVLKNSKEAEDAMIAKELQKNINAWSYVMGKLAEQLEAAFYSNTQDLINAIYGAIGGVPGLAGGGIVMRGPRLVRVAEQVAEAIVPLDRLMNAVPYNRLGMAGVTVEHSTDQDRRSVGSNFGAESRRQAEDYYGIFARQQMNGAMSRMEQSNQKTAQAVASMATDMAFLRRTLGR